MNKIKNTIIAIAVAVFISGGSVYASFPVKKDSKTEQTSKTESSATSTELKSNAEISAKVESVNPEAASAIDNEMLITLLLWFFLGAFAAHRWYRGKPAGWNILFILTLGGCGVWAIVDLVHILTNKF